MSSKPIGRIRPHGLSRNGSEIGVLTTRGRGRSGLVVDPVFAVGRDFTLSSEFEIKSIRPLISPPNRANSPWGERRDFAV
jgi:hypothetical protein